ncbi:Xaa-Pro dipeptidyl-peptidase [Streptomyces caniscabiei]|uniref:Xaa-Pro dipeptidyl-peptidase n=1 Tax=Streptomyces caniscabiei TaxID=2746961 RepID=UPI0029AAEAF7|nr:Xaa-Pro dipeptidyl-peptidase [Streptomyces caniscabiei]MDX2603903.1 Xaa-Pro dipeptidyl-peptidase [Streptomyces caniscabiei]MDX2738565.1 Xaa-Pro dipeptidyl-peptidase [Streptomyces caniscabiei]MDX2781361.1 Xaa-Pro dipeptidyl-peptidase [Streptomyces caniscabiei]
MPIPVRRTRFTTWRTLATTAAAAALTATFLTPAAAGTPTPRESRPVYSYDDAVRESVWVDTGLDGDRDGKPDRVAVDIVRPSEPAARGRDVPVIMDASPYYSCCGRGNESQRKTYDANGNVVQMPLFYDNYFVPRGYAFVAVDLAGTNRSDGCVDVGGRSDIQSAKAVVDWLNGRGRAYTTRTGTTKARAGWTNGRTGMIGKSYDGTIANGVAATGVEGLETIVPIGAISSWYDYYFAEGAPLYNSGPEWLSDYVESPDARAKCGHVQRELVEGAPRTGDWTPLWTQRDYVKDVRKIDASVFVVHGQQDLNVRAKHFGQWWDALAKHGVERKIWLSEAGHVDPFDFRRAAWVDTLHRWFDHELLGYDNGIDDEPMADIERHPDQWETSTVWPPRGTRATTLRPAEGDAPGVGTLGLRKRSGTETFTDDPALNETDWAAHVDRSTPEKAGFVTAPLTEDLRLSGSSKVTVTATPTTSTAHLSAVLVDLGPDTIRDYAAAGEGITTLTERTCWGPSTTGDSSCFRETKARTADVDYTIFSRGWADLGNHSSATGTPLTPGTPYTITLDLHASDHVVPAGHRLALIVAGTDEDLIDPPSSTPTLTIDLGRTSAQVPLVGGRTAFEKATSGATARPEGSVLDGVRDPSRAARVPGGGA